MLVRHVPPLQPHIDVQHAYLSPGRPAHDAHKAPGAGRAPLLPGSAMLSIVILKRKELFGVGVGRNRGRSYGYIRSSRKRCLCVALVGDRIKANLGRYLASMLSVSWCLF